MFDCETDTLREFFIANYLRCCAASILEKLHFYAGRKAPKLLGAVRNGFCNVCAVVSINDRDVDFLLVLRADDRLGRGGRPGGRHGRVGLAQPGWQLPLRTD